MFISLSFNLKLSSTVKPIGVLSLVLICDLLHRFESNSHSDPTDNLEGFVPFGTRLSSQKRITYKNLGNFQLAIMPKTAPLPAKTITLPVHRIVHPVQYVDTPPRKDRIQESPVVQLEATTDHRPPLVLNFRSLSSEVRVSHNHVPSSPQFVRTETFEEPQVMIKEVKIPVIQEIFEYITPKRYYTREIRPVIEIQNRLISHNGYRLPIDMTPEESNEITEQRSHCIRLDDTLSDSEHFYNGETPLDMRYNSSRSFMSYFSSNNKLFNIMRKYRD